MFLLAVGIPWIVWTEENGGLKAEAEVKLLKDIATKKRRKRKGKGKKEKNLRVGKRKRW